MFGFAHSFNWDLYKVLPAFLAGLAMGYLFLKFGLYAAIMFHFFTDYLSISMTIWPNIDGLTGPSACCSWCSSRWARSISFIIRSRPSSSSPG